MFIHDYGSAAYGYEPFRDWHNNFKRTESYADPREPKIFYPLENCGSTIKRPYRTIGEDKTTLLTCLNRIKASLWDMDDLDAMDYVINMIVMKDHEERERKREELRAHRKLIREFEEAEKKGLIE